MQKAEIFQQMEHKLYPPEMKNKIWNFQMLEQLSYKFGIVAL